MKWFRDERWRGILLLSLLGLTLYRAKRQLWPHINLGPSQSPLEEEYDTQGKVPGDPQNAVSDLKRIYQVIQTFKKLHGLLYPRGPFTADADASTSLLSSDLTGKRRNGLLMVNPFILQPEAEFNLSSYGFKSRDEVQALFRNPDLRFSDSASTRENWRNTEAYQIAVLNDPFQRLNGTLTNSPKLPGTRDVLLYTSTYYHKNIHRGNGITMHPVGFYVVLWDDGQVEKIPYQKQLWAPSRMSPGYYLPAFRGQAGLPKHTLTYDQYFNQLRFQPKLDPGGTLANR